MPGHLEGHPDRVRLTLGLQGVNTLRGHVQRSLDATFPACAARCAGRYLGACAYRSNRRY